MTVILAEVPLTKEARAELLFGEGPGRFVVARRGIVRMDLPPLLPTFSGKTKSSLIIANGLK